MSDDDAWYLTELGERAATIGRLEVELGRWRNRVRELEDAIIMHRDQEMPDEVLWGRLGDLWT